MIGLLVPPIGTWGPLAAAEGSVIVVREEDAADPRVVDLRARGVKVWAAFDPFVIPLADRLSTPLGSFEASLDTALAPNRDVGVAALDDDEVLKTVQSRAATLARPPLDGIIVHSRVGYRTLFRYSAAARQAVVDKFGLDPLDFREPLEVELEPNDAVRKAELMPEPMRAFLAERGQTRWRAAIRPLEGRTIRLVVDPGLLDLRPMDRLAAFADWTQALDMPGLVGLAVRGAKGKNPERLAKVAGVSPLAVWVYGTNEELEGVPDGVPTFRRTP